MVYIMFLIRDSCFLVSTQKCVQTSMKAIYVIRSQCFTVKQQFWLQLNISKDYQRIWIGRLYYDQYQSGPQSVSNFQMSYIFCCIMVTKLNALNFLIGLIAILETSSLTTYILKYYMLIFSLLLCILQCSLISSRCEFSNLSSLHAGAKPSSLLVTALLIIQH